MKKQVFAVALAALLVAGISVAAQQASNVYRIGFLLSAAADVDVDLPRAILERLRYLGYVEGQNIVVEQTDKVTELVQRKVDVIIVFGTPTALTARKLLARFLL